MNSKVRYTKKDTYIVYDNRRSLVNYIIIGISVLAITLTGLACSASLRSGSAQEPNPLAEAQISAAYEQDADIF